MSSNIKSFVSINGEKSPFLHVILEYAKVKNLSSVLFSLFLNDLESFLLNKGNVGIEFPGVDNDIKVFLKIFILYSGNVAIFVSRWDI